MASTLASRIRATVLLGAVALVGTGVATVGVASPAGAAPATGCKGQATSFDARGRALDKATAPGAGGTEDDPFHVDVNGRIQWRGSTTEVLQDGSYTVKASGFTVASGKLKNDKGNRSWSGTEDVGKRLDKIPLLGWLTKTLKPTATLRVDYTVQGLGRAEDR